MSIFLQNFNLILWFVPKVNIIPVIAQADSETKSELQKLKTRIRTELMEIGVQVSISTSCSLAAFSPLNLCGSFWRMVRAYRCSFKLCVLVKLGTVLLLKVNAIFCAKEELMKLTQSVQLLFHQQSYPTLLLLETTSVNLLIEMLNLDASKYLKKNVFKIYLRWPTKLNQKFKKVTQYKTLAVQFGLWNLDSNSFNWFTTNSRSVLMG